MDQYHQILCLTLKETGKNKVLEAVKALEARPDVLSAEPDYLVAVEENPDDSYYSLEQWGPQKINLTDAWDYVTGTSTFCVGVLDTGIYKAHNDLNDNVNADYSRDCRTSPVSTVSSVTDPNGHGTHVAGIIGAIGSNSQGVSGVCWNTKLVSLRVLDELGVGSVSSYERAINYATSTLTDDISINNIRILNMSLGNWTSDSGWSGVLCAISIYPGLVVCSAGNDSRDNDIIPHYPSQFTNQLDNVISVGASTELDEIADFSNYGETTVDIFAPGDDILSCFPYARCSSTNCTVAGHFAYGYHS